MRNAILVLLCLLSSSPATATAAGLAYSASYSTKTVAQPVFDAAQVAVETTMLNNWLNNNYSRLTPDQMTGPREHLYYLIDSHIKQQFEQTGNVLPKEQDLILEILFSWSDRLGVFGGSHIYKALNVKAGKDLPASMRVPDNFSLKMDGDLLRVRSQRGGWSVAVPYYFMIWQLKEFTATNGLETQLLTVSTGAAKHTKVSGHSQATLMLISSPSKDVARFRAYWMDLIGISDKDKKTNLGPRKLVSHSAHDAKTDMHKELVFFDSGERTFAVFYSGIGGPYEWNRPHFIDFLRAIELPK